MTTVSIVWADPAAVPASLLGLLDAGERARHDALLRPADRQRFLAAHALTRLVLGEVLDTDPAALAFVHRCATCGGPHGKPALRQKGVTPFLDSGRPEFSVSHAGDRVVVAVAGAPVGVDVETAGAALEPAEFAAVTLAPTERRALGELPPGEQPAALLRTWVRKEAVLKATGRGLAVPPDRVELAPPGAPPALVAWGAEDDPGPVALADVDLGPGRIAAVAVLAPTTPNVEIRAWSGRPTFAGAPAG
ncbi:4'-phosphopantetheinyl transferase family protein [Sporichthya polymorpha]|uniref:4'-phosphopantetheinyl transferase family protein n=1 Tax=Sporichthya polymorpha TaxID=35751 RepID=UPI00037B6BBC|nr:4'-phosphopantetheinyl transferase superfamily protein [Sporichthya polymorpha]